MDVPEDVSRLPGGAEIRLLQTDRPASVAASAEGSRTLGDMWRMSRGMSALRADVLLFPTIYSFVPTFNSAKKIVMIHDVIAETYPKLTLPRTTARLFWKLKVALGRMQADAIVTVSEFSRRGIVEHFGIAPERVFVVGEASDPVFRVLPEAKPTPLLCSLGIDPARRMIVYVGGFGPHKNLEALVDAVARLAVRPEFRDLRLVMVGEYKKEVFYSHYSAIAGQVSRLGIADKVIFTGYLPDEELVVLLNLSTLLALPSLMEGFGLPAVEAAACGRPVIATTQSPLPDLLQGAGIFINPHAGELESALETILASPDLRRQMSKAAVGAAQALTWDAAARQMMSVIHQVAG